MPHIRDVKTIGRVHIAGGELVDESTGRRVLWAGYAAKSGISQVYTYEAQRELLEFIETAWNRRQLKSPAYRVRFIHDPDASFEESNGQSRPLTEEEYVKDYYNDTSGDKIRKIPYAEYLTYYGNPDRHVYLMAEVQRQCPCCNHWRTVGGTGFIDFMDDSPELAQMDHWFPEDEIGKLTGYLKEIAEQDLSEAKAEDES